MKVNGIDISKYRARQMTVDVQPPSIGNGYEWPEGAIVPIESKKQVNAGHLVLTIYFRGKDRNAIIRTASDFMTNFQEACILELDGYQGKYKGFMTYNDYEKLEVKTKYVLKLEFDGYFYDDEIKTTFDGLMEAKLSVGGTRETPCVVEVTAKSDLVGFEIQGFGKEKITVEQLQEGSTIIIDGRKGIATIDGNNAFPILDLWEFPKLVPGANVFSFSGAYAIVTVRYCPMWI